MSIRLSDGDPPEEVFDSSSSSKSDHIYTLPRARHDDQRLLSPNPSQRQASRPTTPRVVWTPDLEFVIMSSFEHLDPAWVVPRSHSDIHPYARAHKPPAGFRRSVDPRLLDDRDAEEVLQDDLIGKSHGLDFVDHGGGSVDSHTTDASSSSPSSPSFASHAYSSSSSSISTTSSGGSTSSCAGPKYRKLKPSKLLIFSNVAASLSSTDVVSLPRENVNFRAADGSESNEHLSREGDISNASSGSIDFSSAPDRRQTPPERSFPSIPRVRFASPLPRLSSSSVSTYHSDDRLSVETSERHTPGKPEEQKACGSYDRYDSVHAVAHQLMQHPRHPSILHAPAETTSERALYNARSKSRSSKVTGSRLSRQNSTSSFIGSAMKSTSRGLRRVLSITSLVGAPQQQPKQAPPVRVSSPELIATSVHLHEIPLFSISDALRSRVDLLTATTDDSDETIKSRLDLRLQACNSPLPRLQITHDFTADSILNALFGHDRPSMDGALSSVGAHSTVASREVCISSPLGSSDFLREEERLTERRLEGNSPTPPTWLAPLSSPSRSRSSCDTLHDLFSSPTPAFSSKRDGQGPYSPTESVHARSISILPSTPSPRIWSPTTSDFDEAEWHTHSLPSPSFTPMPERIIYARRRVASLSAWDAFNRSASPFDWLGRVQEWQLASLRAPDSPARLQGAGSPIPPFRRPSLQ